MNDHGARVAYLSMPAMCSGLSSAALSSRLLGYDSCRSRCCCNAAAANLFRPWIGTRLLLLPSLCCRVPPPLPAAAAAAATSSATYLET